MNDELLRFVREALARGLVREAIRDELRAEFESDDGGAVSGRAGAGFRRHGPGRRCFRFEVTRRDR
jgi:hypothetical protein